MNENLKKAHDAAKAALLAFCDVVEEAYDAAEEEDPDSEIVEVLSDAHEALETLVGELEDIRYWV